MNNIINHWRQFWREYHFRQTKKHEDRLDLRSPDWKDIVAEVEQGQHQKIEQFSILGILKSSFLLSRKFGKK